MHDIDRTQLEAEEPGRSYESGQSWGSKPDSLLPQMQELELASRLLEVSDEQELEQFLGDVFRAVGSTVGKFAHSDAGKALGDILRNAVGQALPIAGSAVGGDLAQRAGSLLGLELEGLSPQDQEFETARHLVRFAGDAYHRAIPAPRNVPPRVAARMAATSAARRFAPGLLRPHARLAPRYGGTAWPGRRYGYPNGRRPQPWRWRWEPVYQRDYRAAPYSGDEPADYDAAVTPPSEAADLTGMPADDAGAGELEVGPADSGRWPALASAEHNEPRGGRWERRGRVLIIYGA